MKAVTSMTNGVLIPSLSCSPLLQDFFSQIRDKSTMSPMNKEG